MRHLKELPEDDPIFHQGVIFLFKNPGQSKAPDVAEEPDRRPTESPSGERSETSEQDEGGDEDAA